MKRSILFLLTIATLFVVAKSPKVGKQEIGKDQVEVVSLYSFNDAVVESQLISTDFAPEGFIIPTVMIYTGFNEVLSDRLKTYRLELLDVSNGEQITQTTNYRSPRDRLTVKPGGNSNKAWLV